MDDLAKRIAECLKRNKNMTDRQLAKNLRTTVGDIRRNRCGVVEQGGGRTLAEFRSVYDKDFVVPAKIASALKRLGANGWETEMNFARMAGISMQDISNYREKYMDHVVLVERGSRRIWAGTKGLAAKLRSMTE